MNRGARKPETAKRSPIEDVERDFLNAIERLLSGRPNNKELQILAAKGALKINTSTVAQEAGRSRTSIALKSSRLPEVRKRIQQLSNQTDTSPPSTSADVISRLHAQVTELKKERDLALSQQANHLIMRTRAEREAAKWRDALRRHDDHAKEDGKVVSIRATT